VEPVYFGRQGGEGRSANQKPTGLWKRKPGRNGKTSPEEVGNPDLAFLHPTGKKRQFP